MNSYICKSKTGYEIIRSYNIVGLKDVICIAPPGVEYSDQIEYVDVNESKRTATINTSKKTKYEIKKLKNVKKTQVERKYSQLNYIKDPDLGSKRDSKLAEIEALKTKTAINNYDTESGW